MVFGRAAAVAAVCVLLGCCRAHASAEERLIGWQGEVSRSAGRLRGGGAKAHGGGEKHVATGQPWAETLAWAPRAFLYHNFLSKEECEHIMALAKPRLRRSQVVDPETGGEKLDDIRTSYGTFLDAAQTPMIKEIEKRVGTFSQVPVENQEQLQVLHYGIGQQYRDHWDYFEDTTLKKAGQGGQRVATVLMFLTEVLEGGETVFPYETAEYADPKAAARAVNFSACAQRGPAIKPQQGDAVLFWSLDSNGKEDKNSLHASCPVIRGEKWTATKWLHVEKFPAMAPRVPNACVDREASCKEWAAKGECKSNSGFMLGVEGYDGKCIKSCCLPHRAAGVDQEECAIICDKQPNTLGGTHIA